MNMAKWKPSMLIVMSITLVGVLGACSTKEAANTGGKESKSVTAQSNGAKIPEHLPKDFPLPKDADLKTSHSDQSNGKKSALLVFSSREQLGKLADTYKDYFRKRGVTDSGETIDEKNLIIQGSTDKENWSLIGGTLSSQEGVNELTLTWSER
ncbi:hypothetical protein [Paenibacillus sp. 1P03SA]|uniref:hypothetical protein n=1 Tax=Paenibacillus sp. 1P03SA TaxID=3132294 RepID=UPI0039A2B63B